MAVVKAVDSHPLVPSLIFADAGIYSLSVSRKAAGHKYYLCIPDRFQCTREHV